MSFLPEVELDEAFGPFVSFRENLGFIPNLFRAQSLLPRVVEAEAEIAGAVLLEELGHGPRILQDDDRPDPLSQHPPDGSGHRNEVTPFSSRILKPRPARSSSMEVARTS